MVVVVASPQKIPLWRSFPAYRTIGQLWVGQGSTERDEGVHGKSKDRGQVPGKEGSVGREMIHCRERSEWFIVD